MACLSLVPKIIILQRHIQISLFKHGYDLLKIIPFFTRDTDFRDAVSAGKEDRMFPVSVRTMHRADRCQTGKPLHLRRFDFGLASPDRQQYLCGWRVHGFLNRKYTHLVDVPGRTGQLAVGG